MLRWPRTGCCPFHAPIPAVLIYFRSGLRAVPYIAYDRTLALGRLVEDLLAHHPLAAHLKRLVECDSPDANYGTCAKGWAFHGCPGLWCMPTSNRACCPGWW